MENIDSSRWGKDHWSLLAYVETRCVDAHGPVGSLDLRRLRINDETHPLLAVNRLSVGPWKASWGTRLFGFFEDHNPALQLNRHDDFDCLTDLEAEGLIDILSAVNAQVRMTERGLNLCAKLRAHKARGGTFAGFSAAA